jgi:hypothetical protein
MGAEDTAGTIKLHEKDIKLDRPKAARPIPTGGPTLYSTRTLISFIARAPWHIFQIYTAQDATSALSITLPVLKDKRPGSTWTV